MSQVFFFKLMFRQLYEGDKCNIMILSCSLKDMVGPQAMAADKGVRTTRGEEKNVHKLIGQLVLGCRVKGVGCSMSGIG